MTVIRDAKIGAQFKSYWGVFGWMTIPAPSWFYALMAVLCGVAVVGLGKNAFARGPFAFGTRARLGLALLAAFAAAQELYLLVAIQRIGSAWYQGRYLFPAVAPIAVLLAAGLLARGRVRAGAVGIAIVLGAVAIAVPFVVIAPAYR